MPTRPLFIITTRLPPQVCGVGTFSWLLHRYWPEERSNHRFFVVNGAAQSGNALKFGGISELGSWRMLGRALADTGGADVLLHYTGRGYHRFGCPVGLSGVLKRWKSKFADARLAIFFHEVPGALPVISRHYWLNLCNKYVVRKLAKLADLVITNTIDHQRTIEKISGRADIHLVPVPSNVENIVQAQPERAATEFVIFGLPFSRWQTLRAFDADIRRWQENGTLTKLHLIGPRDNKFDLRSETFIHSYSAPHAVIHHGELPNDDISQLLSQTGFGLTTANDSTWSKSGTFMAYLAHGCATVIKQRSDHKPLVWSVLPHELDTIADGEIRARTEAARQWYQTHVDWKIVAGNISALIAAVH